MTPSAADWSVILTQFWFRSPSPLIPVQTVEDRRERRSLWYAHRCQMTRHRTPDSKLYNHCSFQEWLQQSPGSVPLVIYCTSKDPPALTISHNAWTLL